ncbi:MAG: hypothetical protein Q9208_001159 [Pyrenodesmia sp. 3 TL-2023]
MTETTDPPEPVRVPIAQLEPSLTGSKRHFEGVVTLIWPYSASNKSFSILLAEPDFRLRRQKGQVRIHFTGPSAKAVSRYDPQSGDRVILYLDGAQWENDGTVSKTPGRGIDWQLRFGERVTLKIQRENQDPVHLDIDHPIPSPEPRIRSPPPSESSTDFASPSTPSFLSTAPFRSQAWLTPAFLKRDRLSSSTYFGTDYDPFDEDEFRDNNRRKKTKFGRASDQWRFTEKSSSPESAPETKKPVAEQAVESGAVTTQMNGHGSTVTSGEPNRLGFDGQAISVGTVVQNAEGPIDSAMVVDDHSTHQVPSTGGAEHDISVSDTAAPQADTTTVDEGVQTLRSGSEPLGQPSEVQEETSTKVHEGIPVSGAPHTDQAVQVNEDVDKEGGGGSPGVMLEEADRATTPEMPQAPNIDPSYESVEVAAEAEEQAANDTHALPSMVAVVLQNQDILQDRTAIQEKLEFANGDVHGVLEELTEAQQALDSARRSPDNSIEGSQMLGRAQSPPEEADEEEEQSEEDDYEEDEEEEEGDEEGDEFGQPIIQRDSQDWLEAKERLRSLRPEDPSTVGSGELERAERYLLEVEQSIKPIDKTNDQEPNESLVHTDPPQGQTVVTHEESHMIELLPLTNLSRGQITLITGKSHATEGPHTESVRDSYRDEVQEKTSTTVSESAVMPQRSPPHDSQEPALLPSGSPSSDNGKSLAAPMQHERAIPQDKELPHVLPSYPEPEAEGVEQDAPPEFFSDGEEREWDPEEEDIIEEERQRLAEGPEVGIDGWSPEEIESNDEMEEEEEDIYSAEDASVSEGYSDGVPNGDDIQTAGTVPPPRTSAVEVISLLDSDDDSVAQSQTDGAAMSMFPRVRRQSFLTKFSSPKGEVKPFDPSPSPLPSTVQDSQPSLYVEEPEPLRADILSQDEDVQPAFDEALKEEQPVNGVSNVDHDNMDEEDAVSEPRSPGEGLAIEDNLDPRLKNKVLTPNDTQSKDERYQTSDISLRSLHDTHDLPTPRLTQQRSSDILIPASLRPSSPVVPSSSPPLSIERPSSPRHIEESVPLVDHLRKLKDEARLSAKQSPKSRRVSNIPASVSPWFAPRRSNEVIPASRADNDDANGESNRSLSQKAADSDDVEEEEEEEEGEDDEEEIPSSMPEVAAHPLTFQSRVQRTFTTLPKPSQPPPAGFRTSYAYYAPLSTLPSHFDAQTSTLGIVLAATPIARASSGPRDYYTTIFLTDPSFLPSPLLDVPTSSPSTTTPSHFTSTTIFRPTRSSLPSPLPSGSVLLLRSFKVTHTARAPSLLSTATSAWALFPPHTPSASPAISGPPLEFGAEERGYVRGLWEWWDQLEPDVKASVLEQAEEKVSKAVKKEERERVKGRRLKGMGLRLAPGSGSFRGKVLDRHELRDGKEWSDEVGGGSAGSPTGGRKVKVLVGKHELRDGKEWADVVVSPTGGKKGKGGRELRDRKA